MESEVEKTASVVRGHHPAPVQRSPSIVVVLKVEQEGSTHAVPGQGSVRTSGLAP